jgi:transcriptional regulator with XRE-family HTH domain
MSSHQKNLSARERFARNLRHWRLERGLSQEELSARAELSQTFLSQIENGSRNVSLDKIEKLAEVLEIDVTDLLKQ